MANVPRSYQGLPTCAYHRLRAHPLITSLHIQLRWQPTSWQYFFQRFYLCQRCRFPNQHHIHCYSCRWTIVPNRRTRLERQSMGTSRDRTNVASHAHHWIQRYCPRTARLYSCQRLLRFRTNNHKMRRLAHQVGAEAPSYKSSDRNEKNTESYGASRSGALINL